MQSPLLNSLAEFPASVPFKTVDRQVYEDYVGRYPGYSDFNYTSIYSWSLENAALSSLNENLVLWIDGYHDDKKTVSLLGENAINASLKTLLNYAEQNDSISSELNLIPEIVATKVTDPDLLVVEDPDNHDYLLSTNRYVGLEGSEFSKLRAKLSAFERDYGGRYSVEYMDLSDRRCKQEIIRISKQWAEQGTQGADGAPDEIVAIEKLLANVEETSLQTRIQCMGLFIDGVCEGFCIFETGSNHNKEATFHFMKANLNHRSASLRILVETLRYVKQELDVETANIEQDLGVDGLRVSKMRARPSGFLKKYVVVRRDPSAEDLLT